MLIFSYTHSLNITVIVLFIYYFFFLRKLDGTDSMKVKSVRHNVEVSSHHHVFNP